jgi:hypothetical protein
METCKECGNEYKTRRSLHTHLKKHKLLLEDYYHKHYPRRDLGSGELIGFNSFEQYFSADFNSKRNMKKWVEKTPPEVAEEYFTNFIKERIHVKGMFYIPTQVEMRSIMSPAVNSLNRIFQGKYYEVCSGLGLQMRGPLCSYPKSFPIVDKSQYPICMDTREQTPFKFKDTELELRTLKYGDYTLNEPDLSRRVYIERKSLNDFISSFGKELPRVEAELQRAKDDNAIVVVHVEAPIEDALDFRKFVAPANRKRMKANPKFIFFNVRSVIQRYQNVQFLFTDKESAPEIAKRLMYIGEDILKYDLQLCYDLKLLKP